MTSLETVRLKAGDKARLRREEGRGTGEATVFRLTFQPVLSTPPPMVFVDQLLATVTTDYTVDLEQGVIKFVVAPTENASIVFEYYAVIFTDDEVNLFIGEAGGNTDYATAKMLMAWAANHSKLAQRETIAGGGGMGLVTRDTSLAATQLRETAKAFMDLYDLSPDSPASITPSMGFTEVAWTEQMAERLYNQQIIRDYQGAFDGEGAPVTSAGAGTSGPGTMGPPGPQGIQGEPGPPGAAAPILETAPYNLNNQTNPPPANGQIRLNNSNQAAATFMYISEIQDAGADIGGFLRAIDPNDLIRIQDWNDSSKWHRYIVSGPVIDQGTYISVPITWTAGMDTVPNQKIAWLWYDVEPEI
jgi:hypothetical protein